MANAPDMTSSSAESGALEEGERRALWVRVALGLSVSALLVGAVVWFARPERLWAVWSQVEGGWLAAAAGLYGGVLVTRAVRLAGLVREEGSGPGLLELLWASAGHSFATQLMPARSGELVFPELWRRATGENYAGGLVFLTAIRAVELAVVAVLFSVGLASWLAAEGGGSWWPYVIGGGGVALLGSIPLVIARGLDLAEWVFCETRLATIESLEVVRDAVPRTREAADRLGPTEWSWIVGTSLVVWLLLFGVYLSALAACGLDLGPAQTVVGSAGGVIGNLVPVGAIGSLGTMEAGWTAAFRATGAPVGAVAAAGFLVHAIVVVGTGVTTLCSWGVMRWLEVIEIDIRFH